MQCVERKKKEVEKMREEKERLRVKEVKDKPVINQHSKQLADKIGYEPIYSRAEKLMVRKKKREEAIE